VIRITCVGHIRTSLGKEVVELDDKQIGAAEMIERLRTMGRADPQLGFTKFNTLIIINGGEAFTAGAEDRQLSDGDEIVLLPFSHGG
jgi:molybdopterin converting factor small subunit